MPVYVAGDAQAAQPPPSTRHSNVTPGLTAPNANVAWRALVRAAGPPATVVTGGRTSAPSAERAATVAGSSAAKYRAISSRPPTWLRPPPEYRPSVSVEVDARGVPSAGLVAT